MIGSGSRGTKIHWGEGVGGDNTVNKREQRESKKEPTGKKLINRRNNEQQSARNRTRGEENKVRTEL